MKKTTRDNVIYWSGAAAVLPLLDMALAVYHSGQTFGRLGIDAYVPQ